MSWSTNFITELERGQLAPRLVLEFLLYERSDSPGATWALVSHEQDENQRIGSRVKVGGASVAPGTWRYTNGAWQVSVTGDIQAGLSRVVKGNLARLLVGFEGWDVDDFEPVALGALSQISGTFPEYTFDFVDILAAQQARATTDPDKLRLFGTLHDSSDEPRTTTLGSTYTPGDTELYVGGTGVFQQGSDGKGYVKVDNADGGGSDEPFYLRYDGTATGPTRFTGVTPNNRRGTEQASSGSGSVVTALAYLAGHPIDITRELLTSTGDGTNGADDVLPADWGWGLPVDMLDTDDMAEWKAVIGSTANPHDWEVVVETPIDNGMSWWQGQLAMAGMWLAIRQGQLVVRCAQNIIQSKLGSYSFHDPIHSGITITDDDILETGPDEWRAWHDQANTESWRVRVHYNDGHGVGAETWTVGTTPSIQTSPAVYQTDYDLTDVVWTSDTPPGDQALDVVYRTMFWHVRIPELVRLRCAGLRLAQLCPGDVVSLTTDRLEGRMTASSGGYSDTSCMVTGLTVNWLDGDVQIELAIMDDEVT